MLINTGKIILLFSLLIFVINISLAVEACLCTKGLVNEFVFTNDRLTTQHYTIQKGGSAAAWTTMKMSFELKPGDSIRLIAFTTIPCNANIGIHNLDVTAVSEETSAKQSVNFEVDTCHDFDLIADESITVCIDNRSEILFTLINTGIYPETINLASNYNLSSNQVNLSANQSTVIKAYLTPDFISSFKINIQASNEYKTLNKTFNFNSVACNFFNINFDQSIVQLCEDEEKKLTIRITNGPKTNFFHFLTNSTFIRTPNQVTLTPNQVYDAQLIISSQCRAGIEDANITIYANGSERFNIPLTVDFKSCYQPIVMSSVHNDVSCACSENSYDFKLYNPGSKTVQYALSASLGDIYRGSTKINSITLNPQSDASLRLVHKVPCDFKGYYNYSLTATSISVCNKSSSDSVNSNIKSWAECESVDLSGLNNYRISSEQMVIPVSIKNVGNRPTNYSIDFSGSAAHYFLGASTSFIKLSPGQQETIELTLSPISNTEAFLILQAHSTDNLASDSITIYFDSGIISYGGMYYLLIPISVIAVSSLLFYRKKRLLIKNK